MTGRTGRQVAAGVPVPDQHFDLTGVGLRQAGRGVKLGCLRRVVDGDLVEIALGQDRKHGLHNVVLSPAMAKIDHLLVEIPGGLARNRRKVVFIGRNPTGLAMAGSAGLNTRVHVVGR